MSGWVAACRLEDIEREGVFRFDYGAKTFAVYRGPDDSVYCTDGLCTHEAVHLADGLVMDFEIECPKHAGAFDYRTGEAVRLPPCVNLRTYPAEVADGKVRIAIESPLAGPTGPSRLHRRPIGASRRRNAGGPALNQNQEERPP